MLKNRVNRAISGKIPEPTGLENGLDIKLSNSLDTGGKKNHTSESNVEEKNNTLNKLSGKVKAQNFNSKSQLLKPIPIAQLFHSIQGEGIDMGRSALFIRVAGCNLTCPTLPCDTPTALTPTRFPMLRWEEIWEWCFSHLIGTPLLVFTGGEPMIYARQLYPLLLLHPFSVEVETNGTILPPFKSQPVWRKVRFVISPKLSNSGEPKKRRFKPEVLSQIARFAPDSILKFVLPGENPDRFLPEIEEITKIAPLPVYLMPQSATLSQLNQSASAIAQFALTQGFNYSDRLHLRLQLP